MLSLLAVTAAAAADTAAAAAERHPEPAAADGRQSEWVLTFSEEFDGSTVNASRWRVADGGTHGDELSCTPKMMCSFATVQ